MNGARFIRPLSLGLLLMACSVLFVGGCATSEPDNASVRPWNAPKTWETGLPSNAFEGR